jgi:hypothetical protein
MPIQVLVASNPVQLGGQESMATVLSRSPMSQAREVIDVIAGEELYTTGEWNSNTTQYAP